LNVVQVHYTPTASKLCWLPCYFVDTLLKSFRGQEDQQQYNGTRIKVI
jgi:hypothetical protein